MASHPDSTRPWREASAFRQTFLAYIMDRDDIATFERFGELLFWWCLEFSSFADMGEKSCVHETLRAASEDLRYLEGYLQENVAQLDEAFELDSDFSALAKRARGWSGELGEMAHQMEEALAL